MDFNAGRAAKFRFEGFRRSHTREFHMSPEQAQQFIQFFKVRSLKVRICNDNDSGRFDKYLQLIDSFQGMFLLPFYIRLLRQDHDACCRSRRCLFGYVESFLVEN
jgi:hypothetical protein